MLSRLALLTWFIAGGATVVLLYDCVTTGCLWYFGLATITGFAWWKSSGLVTA